MPATRSWSAILSVLERHARACGIEPVIRAIGRIGDADWSDDRVNVLDCAQPDSAALDFGTTAAASGRASLAFADAAIKAALAGEVDAVVAAPQNETSIAHAGIQVRRLSIVRRARDRHRRG